LLDFVNVDSSGGGEIEKKTADGVQSLIL